MYSALEIYHLTFFEFSYGATRNQGKILCSKTDKSPPKKQQQTDYGLQMYSNKLQENQLDITK